MLFTLDLVFSIIVIIVEKFFSRGLKEKIKYK